MTCLMFGNPYPKSHCCHTIQTAHFSHTHIICSDSVVAINNPEFATKFQRFQNYHCAKNWRKWANFIVAEKSWDVSAREPSSVINELSLYIWQNDKLLDQTPFANLINNRLDHFHEIMWFSAPIYWLFLLPCLRMCEGVMQSVLSVSLSVQWKFLNLKG